MVSRAMLSIIRDTIRKIPKSKVATYGDVAKAAGFPGAARQVVWALRGARGLPWHRVLGAGGKIQVAGRIGTGAAAAPGNGRRSFPRWARVDGDASVSISHCGAGCSTCRRLPIGASARVNNPPQDTILPHIRVS